MPKEKYDNKQSGSMVFFIFIGVIAFAMLSFAITRSSQTSNKLVSEEQANLAATETLSYANSIRTLAAQMYLLSGIEDTNAGGNGLLFSSVHTHPDYGAPGDQPNTEIFHMEGGSAVYQIPASTICSEDCLYEFTGQYTIPGVGLDTKQELVMVLVGIDSNVCKVINKKTSTGWTETPDGPALNLVRFDGDNYGAAPTVNLTVAGNKFDNKHVFCYRETLQGKNIFVQVLKPR